MYMTTVLSLLLVLQCCELCVTIKVPVTWNDGADSEVIGSEENTEQERPTPNKNAQTPIPIEYFEYNAPKPQFAVQVAKFHGVQNPAEHYKSYPIRPHIEENKPHLGVHHIREEDKKTFRPYQRYVNNNEGKKSHVKPVSTGYEIFHPYKAEEPALQEIYKDPVLAKIRNDLEGSKSRLQAYENEAGKPHITNEEYSEGPKEIDRKLFPHKNSPAPYEIHRPERRPIYYNAPIRHNPREQVLNQKFKHPLNQNYVKIRPTHYKPLKSHLQQLRQQHAIKYNDEHNEYPQIFAAENYAEPDEGYDTYERGKEKFNQLRNNVDESINRAVKENEPANYKKLEIQNDENKTDNDDDNDDEDEFVPIKNYAQVRKTEVVKHLPRKSAYDDAETLEEILNAPRLREAIKSAKAQTVYTEEGYEDAAYDHAGEHKQASDHEDHGGYLKENQASAGLYKIPSVSGRHEDGKGSTHGENVLHREKWEHDNKNQEEEIDDENYSEAEGEKAVNAKIYEKDSPKEASYRNKREGESKTGDEPSDGHTTISETESEHDVDKREVDFEVPQLNVTSTFLSEPEILKIAKQKIISKANDEIKEKYPYYFDDLKNINKNSPLKYAENLKFIPEKSNGGTEFYDSRSKFICPEVGNIDPIPEKIKHGGNPTEKHPNSDEKQNNNAKEEAFDTIKKQPRLKGLGDKIDCFKAKYFGENPLDSPFFKEEVISNPEPVTAPNLPTFKLDTSDPSEQQIYLNSNVNNSGTDIFILLDKLRAEQEAELNQSLIETKKKLKTALSFEQTTVLPADVIQRTSVNNSVVDENKNDIPNATAKPVTMESLLTSSENPTIVAYDSYHNKEEITKAPPQIRKKRSTPFVYEPYKIIRDGQVQDSKKTTTTSNISPLIKQLQSSRVVDRVTKINKESDKPVQRNTNTRTYIDIGKKDREKPGLSENKQDTTIVDVSIDPRRGEPRYEVRPANHKTEYIPVENKKSMSIEDYKSHTVTENIVESTTLKVTTDKPNQTRRRSRQRKATVRPNSEVQSVAASNTVRKTVVTDVPQKLKKKVKNQSSSEENEDVDIEKTTTPTTTNSKPSFRRRVRTTTTTEKPEEVTETDLPKLRLITRFRDYKPPEITTTTEEATEPPTVKKYKEEYDITAPKYREKKKKTSTSTLVTDTKKYGNEDEEDDEDDRRREEVDALIGVRESLDDFIPIYHKEDISRRMKQIQSEEDEDEDSGNDDEERDSEYDSDSDEDDDDEEDEDEEDEEEDDESEVQSTTTEPTKRTLVRTTDAPAPTTASRSAKLEAKPIVTKKKIEIHKETPVNKSSPHVSQFKQDIKEVEIIKEIPTISKKKPQKNVEALELYKDDNLATDINKLGDVEIFRENLDLDQGPKHGGNYRSATKEDLKELAESTKAPKDAEASQSENTKQVEIDEFVPKRMHGGNLKSLGDIQKSRSRGRSSRLVELNDPPNRGMHGGNLRYGNANRGVRRGGRKSEKLIELDETRDNKRDDSSKRDENFKAFNPSSDRLHGGNYRSAKLVQAPEKSDVKKDTSKNARRNAAGLLSSFAQAVPILTTTPGYILDPSKRMYYYVDA